MKKLVIASLILLSTVSYGFAKPLDILNSDYGFLVTQSDSWDTPNWNTSRTWKLKWTWSWYGMPGLDTYSFWFASYVGQQSGNLDFQPAFDGMLVKATDGPDQVITREEFPSALERAVKGYTYLPAVCGEGNGTSRCYSAKRRFAYYLPAPHAPRNISATRMDDNRVIGSFHASDNVSFGFVVKRLMNLCTGNDKNDGPCTGPAVYVPINAESPLTVPEVQWDAIGRFEDKLPTKIGPIREPKSESKLSEDNYFPADPLRYTVCAQNQDHINDSIETVPYQYACGTPAKVKAGTIAIIHSHQNQHKKIPASKKQVNESAGTILKELGTK